MGTVLHKNDWPSNILIDCTAVAQRLVGLFGGLPEQGPDLVDRGSSFHGLGGLTTHNSRAIAVALVTEKEDLVRIEGEKFSSRTKVNTASCSLRGLIHFIDVVDLAESGRIIYHSVTLWYRKVSRSRLPSSRPYILQIGSSLPQKPQLQGSFKTH